MRKLFTLIAFSAITLMSNAQIFTSNFENWTSNLPDGWWGSRTTIEQDSINQITTGTQYGNNAIQLINTESISKRFSTQPIHVDGGTSYEIKFWVKGNGDIATRLYDTTYEGSVTYLTVNTTTWTEYSQTVTASITVDTAQFLFYIRNTSATEHLQIDSVAISTTTISFVSVYDIQYSTTGDSPYSGQTVNTGGIVTAVEPSGQFFIQGGPGAWNGIFVYDTQQQVAVGDSVTFTADVSEYYDLTELSGVTGLTVVSSGNQLYAPVVITTGTMDEPYEGVLIKINNAVCTNVDAGYGMWTIDDGSGALNTDDDIYSYTPTANEHYDITGIGHYSYGEYKILPRDINDITVASGINTMNKESFIAIFPNPATTFFTIQTKERIASVELYNVVGEKIKTYSGSLKSYPVSELRQGIYFVKILTEKGLTVTRKIKISE